MEINKEEARRLWEAQFGKNLTPCDFAGRKMNKASYNDRNSKYGWNVDHILPQSRGGKTADHNLICCHVLTNDEKADKFPCFKANGQSFEIQKRQNHYEIFSKSERNSEDEEEQYNLMDYAQGLACWHKGKGKGKCPENRYIQYATIRVRQEEYSNTFIQRLYHFIDEIFPEAVISMENNAGIFFGIQSTDFTVIRFDAPMEKDDQEWLDAAVLLNTYATAYFERKYDCTIRIRCGIITCGCGVGNLGSEINSIMQKSRIAYSEHLSIDSELKENTDADDKVERSQLRCGFYPYNYTFTKLRKQLEKQE